MCSLVSYKKKISIFFSSLKKRVVSISQRYGSGSGSAPKFHGSSTLILTDILRKQEARYIFLQRNLCILFVSFVLNQCCGSESIYTGSDHTSRCGFSFIFDSKLTLKNDKISIVYLHKFG